jgi:Tol biopolymer transport system component
LFMQIRILLLAAFIVCPEKLVRGFDLRLPTIDEMMNLRSVESATAISPDGRRVAYTVSQADFRQDTFVEHIWIAEVTSGKRLALTTGERSFYAPQWSPDGTELACLSVASGGTSQLFLISPGGGKPVQITDAPSSVQGYAWSPDGKTIAFTSAAPEPRHLRERRTQLGSFLVVGKDRQQTLLWVINVSDARQRAGPGTGLLQGTDLNVGGFSWSPDGSRLAFSAIRATGGNHASDVFVLRLSTGEIREIVSQAGRDRDPAWSPDGRQIVFTSDMGKMGLPAYNYELAVVPAEGGKPRPLTTSFDENPRFVAWNKEGIYFWGRERTAAYLFRLSPETGLITRVSQPDALLSEGFSLSSDSKVLAFTASSPISLAEVFVKTLSDFGPPRKLTEMTAQIDGPRTLAARGDLLAQPRGPRAGGRVTEAQGL